VLSMVAVYQLFPFMLPFIETLRTHGYFLPSDSVAVL
jgi:hypothetical protein